MIRVLHFITGLEIGGAEMSLFKLILHADRRRFQHHVIPLRGEGALGKEIRREGSPVYPLRMKEPAGFATALPTMAKLVRSIHPDILQGWMYHGNLAASFSYLVTGKSIPLLWNIRGIHTDLSLERPFTTLAIRMCGMLSGLPHTIVNNSHASAAAHQARFGYSREKWQIVPNGFDTAEFAPSDRARKRLRAGLGLGPDTPVIGHVGNYSLAKSHATLVRAMALLRARRPDAHLVMLGRRVDTSNLVLGRWIRQLDLGNSVHLLGARRDVADVTAAFDIATSASIAEGFPNAVGEAMSCGVPCVVTDTGDTALLVGDTGRVVAPDDPSALAGAWEKLIEAGPEHRHELGRRARERVVNMFSIGSVVRQYERLYASVAPTNLPEQEGCAALPAL